MIDIRKIIIIFVIGILFSVLVFATIDAVYPKPDYNDFCKNDMRKHPVMNPAGCEEIIPSEIDTRECDEKGGYIEFSYGSDGCANGYNCETCSIDYDSARQEYNRVVFYISAILALVAIFIGLFLPAKANTLNEWIGTGFMLGGTFALFFGTMQSYSDLDRIIRPIVIFFELALVIFISYKKIGNLKPDNRK